VREWRPDWRRERRYAGGGIATDHGSHTLYLAFEWMKSYPTAVSATSWHLDGLDTEDNFACSLTFPQGIASAHLSWTAGARRVLYTLHGDQGSIVVEDDEVRLLYRGDGSRGKALGESGPTRQTVASNWADASHSGWFTSLFQQFVTAIEQKDYVSRDTLDAVRTVEVVSAAYGSAQRGSIQVPLYAADHGPLGREPLTAAAPTLEASVDTAE
jgi:predicted dehydrogenase